MCSAIPLLLRFACSRGASPMNRRPVAVPGGSFALLAACRPLPLLFARFICRWQRSQTSPTGYENQIRSPNRLDERSQSRCASSSSPTTHRRTASKHLCLSSDLPPSQQSVSLTFPKSRGICAKIKIEKRKPKFSRCHLSSRQAHTKMVPYSTNPYFTLMRSSFSSMGSAAMRMKITVAAAWIRSIDRPDT